jgi:hypothetical protein
MLKKICLGVVVFVAVVFTSVYVTTFTIDAREASLSAAAMPQQTQSLHGLPMEGLKGAIKPPFLTVNQLLPKGGDAEDKAEVLNVLYAYGFFHDSGNAAGLQSVFTKDGVIEGGWNNNGNTIEGSGCLGRGTQLGRVAVDAAGRTAKPGTVQTARPFPGHSHNIITNVIVQVHGDTAETHAYWTRILANVDGEPPIADAPHTSVVDHGGEYVTDFRRTPEGWRIAHHRIIGDVSANRGAAPRPCA